MKVFIAVLLVILIKMKYFIACQFGMWNKIFYSGLPKFSYKWLAWDYPWGNFIQLLLITNLSLIVGDVSHPSSYSMATYLVVIFLQSYYISL